MTENTTQKKNILDNDPAELRGIVCSCGEKAYRAKQIFGWLSKGVASFDEMVNIPKALREALSDKFEIGLPEPVRMQTSAKDGTRKLLFGFSDGASVESVFMKYTYGNSICISSQAGCRMGCKFCASTVKGLERDLTAGEMLAQVLQMKNITGENIGHVVVMGIGEPFDNYDNVVKFVKLINDPNGYGLGMRNITVSTCGIVPMIEKFGRELPQVNLAVSLHAPNDEIRNRIMPISLKYDMDTLLAACRQYTETSGRRLTFEYALISGVNDTPACANELCNKLGGWLTHVNLIPLNEVDETGFETARQTTVESFRKIIEKRNIPVTVRRTLGDDIEAACGQLRLG